MGLSDSMFWMIAEKIGWDTSGSSLYAWNGMPLGPGDELGRFFHTVLMWSW